VVRQNGGVSTLDTSPVITDPLLDGDHERLSHIVKGKARLTEAMVTGQPVTALCGKVWVPGRDPNRFPLCGTCKEIFKRETGRDPEGIS
jgi:hypothetical protein